MNNKLINFSTFVIAQTDQMKDEIIEYYGTDKNKVVVINNIVDTDTILKLSTEEVKLPFGYRYIASGSLYSVKGFDLLIKAFAEHIVSFPTDKLLIIGKETIERGYKSYLESLITELRLSENVSLLGHQSNPYKYYKNADVFVLSSLKEGFPNVVLENMVVGTPVLITDCIDFTQIINSNIGIIVKRGSVSELVDGLKNIRSYQKYQINIDNFDYNKWFKEISS
jgi:glycosyltransferase involved in cell wall biosynthesis